MLYLQEDDKEKAIQYFSEARKTGLSSSCYRSKCGAIIVKNQTIIGKGFNSPPKHLESQRRCLNNKSQYDPKITDKTCCIHAEQRAIINALKNNPHKIVGSRLYFVRLDKYNNIIKSENPYCTICSKMVLDIGIKEFVLWCDDGIRLYNTEEYNRISFGFQNPKT